MRKIDFSESYQLTDSAQHHFFGYYGICPWSENEQYIICLESKFEDHMPKFEETADILLLDLEKNVSKKIASTHAWNFQQGSMLHWLPENADKKIIYNDTDGKSTYSVIYDIDTNEKRKMSRAINAVGKKKNQALCVSFKRLRRNRRVCSYACDEKEETTSHPKDEGIYLLDLNNDEEKLVVSLDDVWQSNRKTRKISRKRGNSEPELWFNHLAFNFDDSKFFFLARYRTRLGPFRTSMWIANTDGSNLKCIIDYHHKLSHFEWISNDKIVVTMKWRRRIGRRYVVINTKNKRKKLLLPKELKRNGHPTISPQRDLMVTDTYAIAGKNRLYMIDMKTKPKQVYEIAAFQSFKPPTSSLRCDPHPRWNRSGTQICYDGHGKNGRQIYVVDVKREEA